jgi:hypothetical protein
LDDADADTRKGEVHEAGDEHGDGHAMIRIIQFRPTGRGRAEIVRSSAGTLKREDGAHASLKGINVG